MNRTVSDRPHLSIGEVLSLLQDDFPDVTISKIRFLESQGLLDPERTPSGYRKFYDADIDRLRWILRQQRENFLPLKVIKDRLDEVPFEELLATEQAEHDAQELAVDDDQATADPEPGGALFGADGSSAGGPDGTTPAGAPPPPPPPPPSPVHGAPTASTVVASADPPADQLRLATEALPSPGHSEDPGHAGSVLDPGETAMSMTADELARATGLTVRQIGDLERYGLLIPESLGNINYFGEDSVLAARTAAGFMKHGIEARHLRMYKVAAEREAGFLEQVIMPLLKQRDPKARQKALTMLDELVGLGDELRQEMLRRALRDHVKHP